MAGDSNSDYHFVKRTKHRRVRFVFPDVSEKSVICTNKWEDRHANNQSASVPRVTLRAHKQAQRSCAVTAEQLYISPHLAGEIKPPG